MFQSCYLEGLDEIIWSDELRQEHKLVALLTKAERWCCFHSETWKSSQPEAS